MDNRPIGVFDSGIGGLNILAKLVRFFPEEDFIYLGDNCNVPYGNKTVGEISALTRSGILSLKKCGVKAVVLACNTASLNAVLVGDTDIPVIRLIPHVSDSWILNKKGCFLGTEATVCACRGKSYFSQRTKLDYIPLKNLARAIEESVVSRKKLVLADHLVTTAEKYDYVYLGCTHFIGAKEDICRLLAVNKYYDGSEYLIENLSNYLEKHNLYAQNIQSVNFVGESAGLNSSVYARLAP